MTVRTLLMLEDEEGAHFFDLEGDFTRFEGIYINAAAPDGPDFKAGEYEALQASLTILLYGEPVNGEIEGSFVIQELDEPTKDWDHFVRCGFI